MTVKHNSRCKAHALVLALMTGCVVVIDGCQDRAATRQPSGGGHEAATRREPEGALSNDRVVTCDLRCEWTSEGLVARLSFTNGGTSGIRILKRNLLLGEESVELTWSPFEVSHNGIRVPYTGKLVKRAAPTDADYRELNAGEVVRTTVNVSRAYDIAAPGGYRIRYVSVNILPHLSDVVDVVSNSVDVDKK
jgi:hypothetical protein